MGALSRLTDRIDGWRRQRAAFRELEEIGPDGRDALSRDVGVSAGSLSRLVARGPDAAAGLPRLMRALGLDPERVANADRAVARDMEVVCSECRSSSRCARDLDAGKAHLEYEAYCPNAETLSALLQENRGAAPKPAAAPRVGNASQVEVPWVLEGTRPRCAVLAHGEARRAAGPAHGCDDGAGRRGSGRRRPRGERCRFRGCESTLPDVPEFGRLRALARRGRRGRPSRVLP
jgi:hypothetical protein